MLLDRQVQIFSVDTGNFYSNTEAFLHWKNHKLRNERNQLVNGYTHMGADGKTKRSIIGTKEIEKKLLECGFDKSDLDSMAKGNYSLSNKDVNDSTRSLIANYIRNKELIAIKNKAIKKTKDDLLELLANKTEINIKTNGKHHIRNLRENQVSDKNIISVFDSFFTRTIGAKQDEFTSDFMVVQVFYFDIIKDLIYHGFMYEGEKYIYFASSAGQIRTKKCVFVKESVWKKYEKTIMCGLTIDEINRMGGCNPN